MDGLKGPESLPLLESRLKSLADKIVANKGVGIYRTREELARSYSDLFSRMARGHTSGLYKLPIPEKGTPYNEESFNLMLLGIYNEALYLIEAVKKTGSVIESNFNFAVSEINRTLAGIKYCQQQLGIYSLYATNFGNSLFFGETFSTRNNIESGSSLLAVEECNIDLVEGTVSLPVLEEKKLTIASVTLSDNSNGVLGNNIEANTPIRGNIKSLYDGNADTWTEFERVIESEDKFGLKIELRIVLEGVNVVNGLRVVPVNLGGRSPVSISSVEVSTDGLSWISLKDDIRVADFLDETPEDRFHLSPHTGKFSGEFSVTFAPRFVKFVRLKMFQSSSFSILDVSGNTRLRYAIGLREIDVLSRSYAASGEIVSSPITFSRAISAVGVNSLIDPPLLPEDVGKAEYFVSYNDGASWDKVVTLDDASTLVPEISFPPADTTSLRYKILISKDEAAFAAAEEQSLLFTREIFSWPDVRPFTVNLRNAPKEDTVVVYDPELSAVGYSYPRLPIGKGVLSKLGIDSSGDSTHREFNSILKLRVPILDIKDPATVNCYINGFQWTRKTSLSGSTALSQHYILQRNSEDKAWEFQFGNGDPAAPKGAIPSPTDEIAITFDEESLSLKGAAPPYTASFKYPSDGEKDNTTIYFSGSSHTVPTEDIPGGVTSFQLQDYPLATLSSNPLITISVRDSNGVLVDQSSPTSPSSPYGGLTAFSEYKTFVDGSTELTDPGDWTVDVVNGRVYVESTRVTPTDYISSASYIWKEDIYLSDEDWDFVDGDTSKVQIYESGYHVIDRTESKALTSSNKSVSLAYSGIVPKSLRVEEGTFGSYRPFEVPFIDGTKEFKSAAGIQDEENPAITSAVGSGSGLYIAKFQLTHYQTFLASAGVSIDSDVFTADNEKTFVDGDNEFSSDGNWSVDYLGTGSDGKAYIYLARTSSFSLDEADITVSYRYQDPYISERLKGGYSVDMLNGVVFFASSPANGTWKISYKNAPYKARYIISVPLKKDKDYRIDGSSIRVLTGNEFFTQREKKLGVSYKYSVTDRSREELAPYFSPLLRAIAIRAS